MPLFNMVPKDKKSPRRPEVRRSNLVIYVLPLLLCLVAAIAIWCYTVGLNRPVEPETTAPIEETLPREDITDGDATEGDTPPPAESLPADSEAQPSDM